MAAIKNHSVCSVPQLGTALSSQGAVSQQCGSLWIPVPDAGPDFLGRAGNLLQIALDCNAFEGITKILLKPSRCFKGTLHSATPLCANSIQELPFTLLMMKLGFVTHVLPV